ncbi:sigma-70 family RNA polymerase sigma factor [Micromonospora sp. WMMD1120]|uniref:sigma-70 family RNA polymerase sigma factor n=1 Tax=Micromonospora sp. WMMD1120 TaxID=3016106 RepID=UPI0024176EE7|nr:sigma-70 family RNA polymerase sigma factor [Micromonospora sp. WMMD1120]MDG4811130.1 sigma-70 family RNA polymerase sigma factor [Micromonospora sp. WMMD1120]
MSVHRNSADRSLMESVYAAHHRQVLRFLMSLTRNERTAAEDLLQETMLRVWRRLESLPREEEGTRKWLFTIARRVAIDAVRSRQARPCEVSLTEASQLSGVDDTDCALALHNLKTAFLRLSDEHQQVLRELHLHGASIEETSRLLSVPVGTVKSRAHYAMRTLRAAVNPVDRG